ncbi:MAG: hypothetical protein LBI82_06385 [Dysgonamonadaceae bacterium]|jgi:hypothetical protein|nr:hypothetical protein [Dysgonamonadaceae bacterium]
MARHTSFAYQKSLLEDLLKRLSDLEQDLKLLSQRYEGHICSLYENQGLMEEVFVDYDKLYLKPMKQSLSDLSERILSQDIPYIEKEIDYLCSR